MKKIGKFRVVAKSYVDDAFKSEWSMLRTVYADRHGSPFINDTLHGCRVFCMGENPSTESS